MNDESSFKVDCEGQIVTHNEVRSFSKKNYFFNKNMLIFQCSRRSKKDPPVGAPGVSKSYSRKIRLGKPGSSHLGCFLK